MSLRAQDVYFDRSNVTIVGRDQHTTINVSSWQEKVLEELNPVNRSEYDGPWCMEGTRKSILREIDSWLNGMFNQPSKSSLTVYSIFARTKHRYNTQHPMDQRQSRCW
jgi:hypothetical protein